MRTINPKCSNSESFKYSVLISLHYYDLSDHPERIKPLLPYVNKYNLKCESYKDFEQCNPNVSLTAYDKFGDVLYKSINHSNNDKVHIVKINNYRYHAIKPNKNKYIKLKELLQSFTIE